ncbi:hypothetical protein RUMHYD_01745 [Blautia hydrogenotrophica DSM 10507]|uniref:Uncharacterized protein n=1 Tax=Blautia hydrogenotrophica (strain DSM 10507 / JCM 14656 / S5a33) TaxID=476272 RepID=C0CLM3_BLAHS|nr:hypothetical protein RUMHYD_01745 [Blautia hydrogenotrophica DSM 10507]
MKNPIAVGAIIAIQIVSIIVFIHVVLNMAGMDMREQKRTVQKNDRERSDTAIRI